MSSSMLNRAKTPRVGAGVPVNALLFEARLNFADQQHATHERSDRLTRSHRRRRVGVQPTSSAVSGHRFQLEVENYRRLSRQCSNVQ